MRDLVQLEELHLAFAEVDLSALLEDIHNPATRDRLHDYGHLLERLMPRTEAACRQNPVDFVFPELEREARLFSLMAEEEETRYEEMDLCNTSFIASDEEKDHTLELIRRDRRLAHMVGHGIFHRYSNELVDEFRLLSVREHSRSPSGPEGRSISQPLHHTHSSRQSPRALYTGSDSRVEFSSGSVERVPEREGYVGVQRHDTAGEQGRATGHRHPV
jgi:hypothetical protein